VVWWLLDCPLWISGEPLQGASVIVNDGLSFAPCEAGCGRS